MPLWKAAENWKREVVWLVGKAVIWLLQSTLGGGKVFVLQVGG